MPLEVVPPVAATMVADGNGTTKTRGPDARLHAREARKVQITGKSTHIISLPKRWVDRVNLRGGDTVFVVPRPDGSLLVHPGPRSAADEVGRVLVDTAGLSTEFALRRVRAAYEVGWQVLEVIGTPRLTNDMAAGLRTLAKQLVGLQLVEETSQGLIFRVALDAKQISPMSGMRRFHSLVHDLEAAVLLDFTTHDAVTLEGVSARYAEAERLHWLLRRQCDLLLRDLRYAEETHLVPYEAPVLLTGLEALHQVAAAAAAYASNATRVPHEAPGRARLQPVGLQLLAQLDRALGALLADLPDRAEEVLSTLPAIRDELFRLVGAEPSMGSTGVVAGLAGRNLETLADAAHALAAAAVRRHYARLPPAPESLSTTTGDVAAFAR